MKPKKIKEMKVCRLYQPHIADKKPLCENCKLFNKKKAICSMEGMKTN